MEENRVLVGLQQTQPTVSLRKPSLFAKLPINHHRRIIQFFPYFFIHCRAMRLGFPDDHVVIGLFLCLSGFNRSSPDKDPPSLFSPLPLVFRTLAAFVCESFVTCGEYFRVNEWFRASHSLKIYVFQLYTMVMTTPIQKVVLYQQIGDPTFPEESQQPRTRRDEVFHPRTGYPDGSNEALDGFSEEEWPTSGRDSLDDDTVLMNLSSNKLTGLNLSFAIGATGFPSVLSAQASILLQNVLPSIWLRWEHRSEWTHNNMIACSTAAIKFGPCSSSIFHVERKVILHLTNIFEHEEFLEDNKFKGVTISLLKKHRFLEFCSGMDKNMVGQCVVFI